MSVNLLCPKCETPMRVIERSGITLERCSECGGIFLDRGELERLAQAENAFIAERAAPVGAAATPARAYRRDDDDDDDDRDDRRTMTYDRNGKPIKKKRKNFLEDLFDFG